MSIGISAMQSVKTALATTELDVTAPSAQSVAHFEAALNQTAAPEDKLIDTLQASAATQKAPLIEDLSKITQSGAINSTDLLKIQVASMQWAMGVEVGSKVAGSINQSINKLTSMQ